LAKCLFPHIHHFQRDRSKGTLRTIVQLNDDLFIAAKSTFAKTALAQAHLPDTSLFGCCHLPVAAMKFGVLMTVMNVPNESKIRTNVLP